ncbi:hypothetical protein BASA81_012828 [Batrachochytrium salamandrivorans]|nr:hypothetical protein BASA81_012828 [Batrachochytrium salamandrivorans]
MHHRKVIPKGSTGPPSVHLPKDLYAYFESKPVVFFKNANAHKPTQFKQALGGNLAGFIAQNFSPPAPAPVPVPSATPLIKQAWEIKQRKRLQRRAEFARSVQRKLLEWNPNLGNKGEASLTLFVGALDPNVVTETMVGDFMRAYGPVASVRVVRTANQNKSCYAFVEFEDKRSLQNAYHGADKQVLGGRTILVDVERGRTVSNWLPKRFGGGLGGPARLKGYMVVKGRGPPEPPKPVYHNRRRRFPLPPRQGQQQQQQRY